MAGFELSTEAQEASDRTVGEKILFPDQHFIV
jgi:hypothetical protein